MKPLIIPVFVPNQGCPNLCVFCNQKKISGVLQPPAPEDVREIIKTHLETFQDKKENKKCHRVGRPDATRGSGRSPDLPSLKKRKKGDGSFFSKLKDSTNRRTKASDFCSSPFSSADGTDIDTLSFYNVPESRHENTYAVKSPGRLTKCKDTPLHVLHENQQLSLKTAPVTQLNPTAQPPLLL